MDSGRTSVRLLFTEGGEVAKQDRLADDVIFRTTVQAIYEADYAAEFEKLGIWYEHRLIDDVSPPQPDLSRPGHRNAKLTRPLCRPTDGRPNDQVFWRIHHGAQELFVLSCSTLFTA